VAGKIFSGAAKMSMSQGYTLIFVRKCRAAEPEPFFSSGATGASHFVGAGANFIKQALAPK